MKKHSFTMAEILISLTIIGVIAAITLPSLRANINEKAWATQRKALYSRMTQALSMFPSLNGYGIGATQAETDQNAAISFVTEGLNKVLQISNICNKAKLKDCGIPDTIITMPNMSTGRTSKIDFPKNLTELNPMFTSTYITGSGDSFSNPQSNINTDVAAFETKNGESIAVFYNPYCYSETGATVENYTQPYMCANFIYDLNGRKGPNKFGNDIGFISVLYPTDSEIVAPMPLIKNAQNGTENTIAQSDAAAACRVLDNNSRVPNINELQAMFYNEQFLGISYGNFWSNSISTERNNFAWRLFFKTGTKGITVRTATTYYVRCVKK